MTDIEKFLDSIQNNLEDSLNSVTRISGYYEQMKNVYESLAEEDAKREKGCSFCKNNNLNELKFMKNNERIEINFCPCCGKRIKSHKSI